jgi:hypothetical protein
VSCVSSFACNRVVSRSCAFAHGTPTGPLRESSDDGTAPHRLRH